MYKLPSAFKQVVYLITHQVSPILLSELVDSSEARMRVMFLKLNGSGWKIPTEDHWYNDFRLHAASMHENQDTIVHLNSTTLHSNHPIAFKAQGVRPRSLFRLLKKLRKK